MKKFIMCILAVIMTVSLFAQTPQKMSYQAVIRNSAGELVKSHPISMKISIMQGSETGTIVYTEISTRSTNANGLVTMEIGEGPEFQNINWFAGPYFIKIETDPEGGTNYAIVSTSKLLSVPYALHSKVSETFLGGDYNKLINKPVLFDGTWTSLIGKPTTVAGYGIINAMTTVHPANVITAMNIDRWNNAFNWGDHNLSGYLKSTTTGINPNYMKVNLINTVNDGLLVFSTPNQQWEVKPITDFASLFSLSSHTHTELDPFFNQWFELTGQDDANPYDYMGWNGTKWVRTRNTFSKLNHNHIVADEMFAGFMSTMDKHKLDRFPLPVQTEPGRVLISDGNDWLSISENRWSLADHSHSDAGPTRNGFMSVVDKNKLDNFNTVGQTLGDILIFNGTMWVVKSNAFSLPSHTHTNATITASGFMSNTDKTKLDGITPADGSETKITGNPGITIKGNGTIATPYTVTVTQHTVGETYGGGIVFYVYDNGQHGLIAATTDATVSGNPNLFWIFNAQPFTAGAGANGIKGGIANTAAMLAYQTRNTYNFPLTNTFSAAVGVSMYSATDAQGVKYGDWYLPSSHEMLLAVQSGVVPNLISSTPYWSSTEVLDNPNYANYVVNGAVNIQPKNNTLRARAIRSF